MSRATKMFSQTLYLKQLRPIAALLLVFCVFISACHHCSLVCRSFCALLLACWLVPKLFLCSGANCVQRQ